MKTSDRLGKKYIYIADLEYHGFELLDPLCAYFF